MLDKKEWIIALATFAGGFYEIAGGYVTSRVLSVPISCTAGAVAGGLLVDYVFFPNPERKEMNSLFNYGAHAFLWGLVASLILNQVNTGYDNMLVPAISAYGSVFFKNTFSMFG